MSTTIGILLFEGAEELDFVGPWEVFSMAALGRDDVRVVTIAERAEPLRCAKGLRVIPDFDLDQAPALDVVVVPGGEGTRREVQNRQILEWLRKVGESCIWITSVCTGAALLHAAGLASGRRLTTHWSYVGALREAAPECQILERVRYVRDGKLVSAAGVSAGIDMSLWLVGQIWGVEHARRTQHFMEYNPAPPYAADVEDREGGVSRAEAGEGQPIRVQTKLVFASGDHTVNLALSAISLVFMFFLTEVAGLRPALAGLVIWLARLVDAVSDPVMGRISDTTRWRLGRRRPYFLIGALPFGIFFAALWQTPFPEQGAMFAYYLAIYVGLSLSMTVISVPYMALLPEMASGYDERTSLNAFRSGAAVLGTVVAAGLHPFTEALGGGATGFSKAAPLFSLWLVLPWAAVFAVSFERSERSHAPPAPVWAGLVSLIRHRTYLHLCALYISARIAVDVLGLGLLYFFQYWILREQDFAPALLSLLGVVILSLPFWLRVAQRSEKHLIFCAGAGWWVGMLLVMATVGPDWPRWSLFALAGLAGVGYAVADLMPWAMVGEVIDEDELLTGQRREGIYNGFFTFLRKLGGASAFLIAGVVLEMTGYVKNQPQTESALLAIRGLSTLAPAFFLTVAIAFAMRYPLNRARHRQILDQLRERSRDTESVRQPR